VVSISGRTSQAAVGNYVWEDQNRNGLQDPAEPGIAGVPVFFLAPEGGTLFSTTTDAVTVQRSVAFPGHRALLV
jgi:SdrD B-like domain